MARRQKVKLKKMFIHFKNDDYVEKTLTLEQYDCFWDNDNKGFLMTEDFMLNFNNVNYIEIENE